MALTLKPALVGEGRKKYAKRNLFFSFFGRYPRPLALDKETFHGTSLQAARSGALRHRFTSLPLLNLGLVVTTTQTLPTHKHIATYDVQ